MASNCPITTFSNFMIQAKGRDKLFRIFQYIRLLVIPLLIKNESKSAIFLNKFGDTCSTFRKILRLGKVILNTKSCIDKIKANSLAGNKMKASIIFDCLSICSESLYCLVDHIILFNKIQAYKFSDKIMSFCGFHENFLWLLETIFGIIADYFKYQEILKNEKENVDQTTVKQKLFTNQLRLWSDFFVSKLKFIIILVNCLFF